jgi:oligopeptide transport system substrate-binding protein
VLVTEQAMPVHEKTVRLGEDWVKPGKMVSNGAYVLEDWKPSSHIRLVKNPNYWNAGKVAIDAVEFDPTDNEATVLKRYRTGEFDIIINALPNDQLGWLKQNLPKELHLVPMAEVVYFIFNTTKPPFNDQRVRQALAIAINREVLVEKVTRGGQLPAYGVVPDGIANYISQRVSWAKMSQADRDVAAIKLMNEAGYGPRKPLNVRLSYRTSESLKQIMVATAAMWKKLGVNVEFLNIEQKVYTANQRTGDFEVGFDSWGATIMTRRTTCSRGKPRLRSRTTRGSPMRTTTASWTRPRSRATRASALNCWGRRSRCCSGKCRSRQSISAPPRTWSARGSKAGKTICLI